MFRKNGLDPEIVYVTSGSLLSQALIAGNFDVALTRGTTPMLGKLRGSEQYIVANYSNHFNDVFLATPEITSVKQLKGKRIAVSRFGSGSHILTNLVLKQAGLDPQKDVTVLQIGNSAARLVAIMTRSSDPDLAGYAARKLRQVTLKFSRLVQDLRSKIEKHPAGFGDEQWPLRAVEEFQPQLFFQ